MGVLMKLKAVLDRTGRRVEHYKAEWEEAPRRERPENLTAKQRAALRRERRRTRNLERRCGDEV